MTRSRALRGLFGVGLMGLLLLAMFGLMRRESVGHEEDERPGQPIRVAENGLSFRLQLGLKDKEPTDWNGQITVSEGKVVSIDVLQGGPNGKAEGNRFTARSVRAAGKKKKAANARIITPVLRVSLEAPQSARVRIQTPQGNVEFTIADLPMSGEAKFLDDQVAVEPEGYAQRLTGRATEDDHPAMTRTSDGTVWLTYVEFKHGPPIVMEQIINGRYDTLTPSGHGDRIRLVRFDGKAWQPPVNVTEQSLDIWRPTITADGQGRLVIAWAQKVDDDWDIFYRTYTPAKEASGEGQWSKTERASKEKGSDFNVAGTTDSSGTVWLAWQGWRKDNFDIQVAKVGRDGAETVEKAVPNTKANEWSPALCADKQGNVYVAWDTYEKGNYDVRLHVIGKQSKTHQVADSPRYETRANLACDDQNRVWIAYEQGEENWGKDYMGNDPAKAGLPPNPGYGLYVSRTVRVKCLVDGQLRQPAGNLQKAMAEATPRGRSLPRLCVDSNQGVWLSFRHHLLPSGAGEAWKSFATRYNGAKWSEPSELPHSSNLLDNRPALVPHGKGILAVYSSDTRTKTQDRDQDDLFAHVLASGGQTSTPRFVADQPPELEGLKPVHPDESQDVERLRNFKVKIGDKELTLRRGEFHRHTEYSAHRDQDGLLEDQWRYALDAGRLDWMGNGDHDNGLGHEYMWWQIQKVCDLFHNPPHFVAAMSYERSVVYPSGHRNVIMPKRGIRPLPRLSGNNNLFGNEDEGAPDIKVLYQVLEHFGGICSSHTSGTNMGTDWRDNNPKVEPVVEIYQGHRHNYEHFGAPRSPTEATQIGGYQPAGFIWNALEKGYRLGFQSSSDHVSTHMSFGMILVEDLSREGVIDAFKKRHSYAATDNILLLVRSGDHLMGDEFKADSPPKFTIQAHGTTPIRKVHLVRNNKYLYTAEPKKRQVELQYTDMSPERGKTSYYYVRIEQEDGNLAWASPMWITYEP